MNYNSRYHRHSAASSSRDRRINSSVNRKPFHNLSRSDSNNSTYYDPTHNNRACHPTTHHRRVRFIDEIVPGVIPSSNHNVVTRTILRPRTTSREKDLLFYNSEDYAFFALENYYSKLEEETICLGSECEVIKTFDDGESFGWGDYMDYGSGGGSSWNEEEEEENDENEYGQWIVDAPEEEEIGNTIRKVKKLYDLHS